MLGKKQKGVLVIAGISFVAFLLAPMVLSAAASSSTGLIPCDGSEANPCNFGTLMTLVSTVINFLLFSVAMPLAAISFMIAGYIMVTAGGNESKVTTAKTIFYYVLIGLIIALAAWLIVEAMLKGMGLKDEYWLLDNT